MKSVIVSLFVSLLYSRFTTGAAIGPLQAISQNSSLLAGDDAHCSSDYASYGRIVPGSVACTLAIYNLMESPQISTLPSMYPMDMVSSTGHLPTTGNGFRTPWRSSFGDCTVAIALLSEVPARFTPETSATASGQSALISKGSLQQAGHALISCFEPPHGTNIGWAEARLLLGGTNKVGIFAFKSGSPLDQALPQGARIPGTLSSALVPDLTAK